MSLIYCNKPLDLTAAGAVFEVAIPFNNTTLSVFNVSPRAATIDLGRGSTDLPTAAKKFGAQLLWKDDALPAIVLDADDTLDARIFGVFLEKEEEFVVISGNKVRGSLPMGLKAQSVKFGQIGIFEVGTILEINCSQETPEHAPQYWELDAVLGWVEINIWDIPTLLEAI